MIKAIEEGIQIYFADIMEEYKLEDIDVESLAEAICDSIKEKELEELQENQND